MMVGNSVPGPRQPSPPDRLLQSHGPKEGAATLVIVILGETPTP